MTRSGSHQQQRQVFINEYICRQCHFTSTDAEGIRHHVDSHVLEARISFHSMQEMVPAQQLRQRNLLCNPFLQILPSPAWPMAETSGTNGHQRQRNPQSSEAQRTPLQTPIVQVAQQLARPRIEEITEDSTMPLIDQLNQPIPVMIDLGNNENNDDHWLDLTLRF